MSSRKLDDLSERMRPLAVELLARAAEAGIPCRIVETRRTEAEHQRNVANGKSWTTHSRHIDGDAIDVVPEAVVFLKDWAPDNPLWDRLGEIGEAIGLRWGGRWKVRDCAHFEYAEGSSGKVAH